MPSHPIQAVVLRGALDACVEYLRVNSQSLDLFSGSLTNGVQIGCPRHHCLLPTSFTLMDRDSYVEFSVSTTEQVLYFRVQLEFQTRYMQCIDDCAYNAIL